MNQRVLLIYTTVGNTGLLNKAKKIEQGFVDFGFIVDFVCFQSSGKGLKSNFFNWMAMQFRCAWLMLVRKYDVIYMRHAYHNLLLLCLNFLLRKNIKVEINAKTSEDFYNSRDWVKWILDVFSLKLIMGGSYKVFAVTRELSQYYTGKFSGADIVFNPNFVVDEYYSPREENLDDNEVVEIVFLGNTTQLWHGVQMFINKIVIGQKWFAKGCRLHLIGHCSEDIRKIILANHLSKKVIVHGFLTGKEKYDLLNQMDVGICAFNLKIRGIKEATAIKTREYLYSGLPVIIGHTDPAISSDLPFVLSVDLETSDVSDRIRNFIFFCKENHNLRYDAHKFAVSSLLVNRYIEALLNDNV